MLRLNLDRAPQWHELAPGVRVLCAPVTGTLIAACRRDPEVQAVLSAAAKAGTEADNEEVGFAMARAIGRRIVREWEGVCDMDDAPLEVTPEGIAALFDVWPVFEAFQEKVLAPAAVLDAEKNGSAPSPSGTSAGATTTAGPADRPARSARPGKTGRKR